MAAASKLFTVRVKALARTLSDFGYETPFSSSTFDEGDSNNLYPMLTDLLSPTDICQLEFELMKFLYPAHCQKTPVSVAVTFDSVASQPQTPGFSISALLTFFHISGEIMLSLSFLPKNEVVPLYEFTRKDYYSGFIASEI